jgi:hypothetical protein
MAVTMLNRSCWMKYLACTPTRRHMRPVSCSIWLRFKSAKCSQAISLVSNSGSLSTGPSVPRSCTIFLTGRCLTGRCLTGRYLHRLLLIGRARKEWCRYPGWYREGEIFVCGCILMTSKQYSVESQDGEKFKHAFVEDGQYYKMYYNL